MKRTFLLALLLGAPALTHADETFQTLDRMDARSRVGVQTSLQFYPQSIVDVTGLRTEVFGQVVFGGQHGIYGQLPVAHTFQNSFGNDVGLGNLELGYYNHRAYGELGLTLRLGVALPTARDADFLTNVMVSQERITDLVDGASGIMAVRGGASLRGHGSRGLFWQADLSLDVPFATRDGVSARPLVHLNGGVGVDLGVVTLTGELANAASTAEASSAAQHFLHSVGASARVPLGRVVTAAVAYVMPFDFDAGVHAHIVSVSVQGTL